MKYGDGCYEAPLGPDMNSFIYWIRKALDARYADDDSLREPMDQLQKLVDMLPADWPRGDLF